MNILIKTVDWGNAWLVCSTLTWLKTCGAFIKEFVYIGGRQISSKDEFNLDAVAVRLIGRKTTAHKINR